jgi:hypothetical protein
LIDRIRKAGTKDFGVEFSSLQDKEPAHGALPSKNTGAGSNLENLLKNFNDNSLKFVDKIIEKETSLSRIKDPKDKVKVLTDYSKLLVFIVNFNRTYNLIYGSQLDILFYLETNKSSKKSFLKKYYDKAVDLYPDVYNNYNFNQYLYFLESSNLTENIDDVQVKLTDFGKDFLKYIYDSGLSTKRLF